ncbi:SpaA isopeptide-forming pilin-related protein [Geojedonia litorea]|uniref:SpaA isopeptide-forming pilin-related protein n=1 Tax=Geojedonia litorea TaxID=1268269 RepID=A0ABV9N8C8_9FLAO
MSKHLLYLSFIVLLSMACAKDNHENILLSDDAFGAQVIPSKSIDSNLVIGDGAKIQLGVKNTLNIKGKDSSSQKKHRPYNVDKLEQPKLDTSTNEQILMASILTNSGLRAIKESKNTYTVHTIVNSPFSIVDSLKIKGVLEQMTSTANSRVNLVQNYIKSKETDTITFLQTKPIKRNEQSIEAPIKYYQERSIPQKTVFNSNVEQLKLIQAQDKVENNRLSSLKNYKTYNTAIDQLGVSKDSVDNNKKTFVIATPRIQAGIDTVNVGKEKQVAQVASFEPRIVPLFSDPSAHSKRYTKRLNPSIKTSSIKNSKNMSGQLKNSTIPQQNIVNLPLTKTQKVAVTDAKKTIKDRSENVAKPSNQLKLNGVKNNTQQIQEVDEEIINYSMKTIALKARVLKQESSYKTNNSYTLLVEVKNEGDSINPISLDVNMPEDWDVISISKLDKLAKAERKIVMVSFFIPNRSSSGVSMSSILIKSNAKVLKTLDFKLNIANNYDLEVFNIVVPQQVQAGEVIETSFGIRNKGNVAQEVFLNSRNTIEGDSKIIIPKDSMVVVNISQKTNPNLGAYRKISTNLDVQNIASGRTYYNSKSVEVIPTKIKQKDPYFRYPLSASVLYSSHNRPNNHYSTMSAELRGNGYLDTERLHHLNFTLRVPKKENIRRFSVVDQYSLIYSRKNKTTVYLGDHSYIINRLGFGSRYGMGFKLDHNINNWTLSAFYSRPRLFNFNKNPWYGVRAQYRYSDSLQVGITFERSHGNTYNYTNFFNRDGRGQMLTVDYDYLNKNTRVEAELSASYSNSVLDFATDINFIQSFKNISFSSALIWAGKNYLGIISNSLQLTNNLNYYKDGLNIGLGHATSRVHRRLDPLLYDAEPYYEAYFATLGYRFSNKHYVNFRFDKRIREDQLEPSNYHYNEYGVNYRFNYNDKKFTGSFGGRFAKTQNLLIENSNYRNTYSHHLNVSYSLINNLNIRGGLNHIYTNRYGLSELSQNFFRYNIGLNYNAMRRLSINLNYNSGFSPEDSYIQREYINFNLRSQINKNHRLEIRANYFENPLIFDKKELFAYAKYTYTFGVGVKRLFDQGGISGQVFTRTKGVDVKGVKFYTAGKTIVTDEYGRFEMNNLELGINYIYLDESTLPLDVMCTQKNPIEVKVEKNQKTEIDIQLVKSGNLFGTLVLQNKDKAIETNLGAYLKLSNEQFTYYVESNNEGVFKYKNIVPGNYTLTILRFKNNSELLNAVKQTKIEIKEAVKTSMRITVKGKERIIKFKNNNLKVGYNE